jgi:hypothetical protein
MSSMVDEFLSNELKNSSPRLDEDKDIDLYTNANENITSYLN